MGLLYAEGGKIFCNKHTEIYIPMEYFNSNIAFNRGAVIESFGLVYIRSFDTKGTPGDIDLLNIPTPVSFMYYNSREDTITVSGITVDVFVLEYPEKSYILHQTVTKGREIAGAFLQMMLAGKIPNTINYSQLIDIWWNNIEISGVSYKVPSKIFEMIIASIYRDPRNPKKRYGQYYSKSAESNGYDYETGSVRDVVKNLSTFSGIIFEDIGTMISNGINNSIENIDEPTSPLEKIIYY